MIRAADHRKYNDHQCDGCEGTYDLPLVHAFTERCLGRKNVGLSGKGRKSVTFRVLGRKFTVKETSFQGSGIVKRNAVAERDRVRFAPVGSPGG